MYTHTYIKAKTKMSQMCDVAEGEPIKSGYTKAWINDQFKRKNTRKTQR